MSPGAGGLKLRSNIRFVFEGEEEAGSINLGRILAAHKDLFTADVWLICDGPVAQTRQQLIAFGARGVTIADITVYGPRRELHSGHYGNWAPNPALMLARLLASMKDDNGHVRALLRRNRAVERDRETRHRGSSRARWRADERIMVGFHRRRA